ncbi:MAG: cbb3-type cytochrome c oxidase N-terminal domain-containing protein [Bacteroidota bacterium]|jgi:mono/diheme cytochrome c family protein|nr:cbb3-type cytochrome c oxidase N-terminal domain-containing protein [Bacteroidota bacterium]
MNENKKQDELLHHEYDGIQEYDNQLPGWWKNLFYLSIVFAVIYFVHYQVLGTGDSQRVEYLKEIDPNYVEPMVRLDGGGIFSRYTAPYLADEENLTPRMRAELARVVDAPFDEQIFRAMSKATPDQLDKLKAVFPELYTQFQSGAFAAPAPATATAALPSALTEPLTDGGALADGKKIFETQCASCHAQNGSGGIGPNLTDDHWIHGNAMQDVLRTIFKGVPAKGMIAWEKTLKPEQIEQVASYILVTLQGTNQPGKAPEGTKVE